MDKRIISFCLWGDKPKYLVGAIKNAKLAQTIYSNWICRYYVGASVPKEIIGALKEFYNVEVVDDPFGFDDWRCMFSRFLPASESDVSVMISRDTDSRLGNREFAAVQQWLDSPFKLHILRDHPWHGTKILGGAWGVKRGLIPNIMDLINRFLKEDRYQIDQEFLRDIIYPKYFSSAMVHDEIFDKKSFPTKRNGLEFVGRVFDEYDYPVIEHDQVLAQYLNG